MGGVPRFRLLLSKYLILSIQQQTFDALISETSREIRERLFSLLWRQYFALSSTQRGRARSLPQCPP